jgi:hypothetical protein
VSSIPSFLSIGGRSRIGVSAPKERATGRRSNQKQDAGATCIAFTQSGVLVEASAPVPAATLRAHLAPLF